MIEEKAPPAWRPLSTASRLCSRVSRRMSESLMASSFRMPWRTAKSSLRKNSRLHRSRRTVVYVGFFIIPSRWLLADPAAIDIQRLAGDVFCLIRSKKRSDGSNLLRLTGTAQGNLADHPGQHTGVRMFQHPVDHRCLDQARVDAIDADSFRPHFRGDIAGEGLNRQLCRCVVSASGQNLAGLDRTNVDDRTGAAGGYSLAAEYLGAQPLSA